MLKASTSVTSYTSVQEEMYNSKQYIHPIRQVSLIRFSSLQKFTYICPPDLITLLQPVPDAAHTRNRTRSPPDSICTPGTRRKVLDKAAAWARSTLKNGHIYWLHGYVGCGKSAIAQSLAEDFAKAKRLAASFFFYRGAGERSRMYGFARTLAAQMSGGGGVSGMEKYVKEALRSNPSVVDLDSVSVKTQVEQLVLRPFKASESGIVTLLKGPYLIIVDGLDECEDKEQVGEFIDCILEYFKENPRVPLRFFISSRVEEHIQLRFQNLAGDEVTLENLLDHAPDEDIRRFLETEFRQASKLSLVLQAYGDWPDDEDISKLVIVAQGSFIFASTLVKYILTPTLDGATPMDRLPAALNMTLGLDGLYLEKLSHTDNIPFASDVLSTLALLQKPVSISSIARLIGIKPHDVMAVIVHLQALIQIPGQDDVPITFFHNSLRDFFMDETRSGRYFAPPGFHYELFEMCKSVTAKLTYPYLDPTPLDQYTINFWKVHLRKWWEHTLPAASSTLPPAPEGPNPNPSPNPPITEHQRLSFTYSLLSRRFPGDFANVAPFYALVEPDLADPWFHLPITRSASGFLQVDRTKQPPWVIGSDVPLAFLLSNSPQGLELGRDKVSEIRHWLDVILEAEYPELSKAKRIERFRAFLEVAHGLDANMKADMHRRLAGICFHRMYYQWEEVEGVYAADVARSYALMYWARHLVKALELEGELDIDNGSGRVDLAFLEDANYLGTSRAQAHSTSTIEKEIKKSVAEAVSAVQNKVSESTIIPSLISQY